MMILALAGTLGFVRAAAAAPATAPTVTPSADGGQTYIDTLAIKTCPAQPLTLPAETEVALAATLLVRVPDGVGSAFLVSPDGFALTAAHVVDEYEKVTVVSHGGASIEATVVRVDENEDVALLAIPSFGATPCLLPHEGRAAIGSDVFVLGSPAGAELSFSVSKGIVSGLREIAEHRFVQLDASVNPGNSGGPVLGLDGAVLGIASWKLSHVSVEGIAFAVPIDAALASLQITFADATDADWRERGGRRLLVEEATASQPTATARPKPAPKPGVPSTRPLVTFDPDQRKRRAARRTLIAIGIPVLTVGTLTIAITGGIYYGLDGMSRSGWRALQGLNTTGWVLGTLGATALVAGIAIPRRPRKQGAAMSPGLRIAVDPMRFGMSLGGAF